ncbi:hypothetical protein EV182_008750, partial [Spiromyces aspiralis]
MSFPNPKPRNIEKDVKVFSWKILPFALKKIIGKYMNGGTKPSDDGEAKGSSADSVAGPAGDADQLLGTTAVVNSVEAPSVGMGDVIA